MCLCYNCDVCVCVTTVMYVFVLQLCCMCLCYNNFKSTAILPAETMKDLLLQGDKPIDIILYYKVDSQSLKLFVEQECNLSSQMLKDFENICKHSSWALFDYSGHRYAQNEAEIKHFRIAKNQGDLAQINSIVPQIDALMDESNNEEWIEAWKKFKGKPYILQGLLGALVAKNNQNINLDQRIAVYVVHALPRDYGYYMKTWENEEKELLWLWNNYSADYETITGNTWDDFDLWGQLNVFDGDNKYHKEILFDYPNNNTVFLLDICLNQTQYYFGFKKIVCVDDLFSHLMEHNMILLAKALYQQVKKKKNEHTHT